MVVCSGFYRLGWVAYYVGFVVLLFVCLSLSLDVSLWCGSWFSGWACRLGMRTSGFYLSEGWHNIVL